MANETLVTAPPQVPPNAGAANAAPAADAGKTPAAGDPAAASGAADNKDGAQAKPPADKKETPGDKPKEVTKDDLKLPQGSPLDAAKVEEVVSFAKERGLSKEQAQAVLDRENKTALSNTEGEKAKLAQARTVWAEASKSDKEFGGDNFPQNVELAKRVISRFGTDGFKSELDISGLGNHPELLRVFVRIGKAMSEDQLVIPTGDGKGQGEDLADRLYGKDKKGEK